MSNEINPTELPPFTESEIAALGKLAAVLDERRAELLRPTAEDLAVSAA